MQVPLGIFSDSQALIVGKPTPTGFMPGTKPVGAGLPAMGPVASIQFPASTLYGWRLRT